MILRPARPDDATQVADIDLAARYAAMPDVRWAHSPAEVREWISGNYCRCTGYHAIVDAICDVLRQRKEAVA